VFGEHGVRDGSLRQIAVLAGFSTAAIYLFFDNKQHLLAETLTRRGGELVGALRAVAEGDLPPVEKLHRIVDDTVEFFASRPDFRRLIRHITGGTAIVGPTLAEYAGNVNGVFMEAMTLLAAIISDGQQAGDIRDGDPHAIAHFYSVLVNEQVLLAGDEATLGTLTSEQFHGLVDGALRNPTREPRHTDRGR
jgi:AcrR family transcriptional regulator